MDAEALIRDGATKVESILRDAAPKVAEAIEHVVRYNWATGVTNSLIGVALVGGGLYMLARIIRWLRDLKSFEGPEGMVLAFPVTMIAIGIVAVCSNLPLIIEPTGYTIKQLLGGR